MAQNAGVEFDGLKETIRALKKLDPENSKDLRDALRDKVADPVAADARGRLPSVSGRAAGSIRAGADSKGPYVAGGKKAVPYYGWLDFGARTPVTGNPRTIGPWAKSGRGPQGGRAIYPAIDANRGRIEEETAKALDAEIERLLP